MPFIPFVVTASVMFAVGYWTCLLVRRLDPPAHRDPPMHARRTPQGPVWSRWPFQHNN